MSEYVAIERLNGEPIALHHIKLPDFRESGRYRAVRALEAFSSSMHRWFARHMYVDPKDSSKGFYMSRVVPGQYFYISWIEDFAITKKLTPDLYYGLSTHHWDSIYDFLEHVQYDRKNRRLKSWSKVSK